MTRRERFGTVSSPSQVVASAPGKLILMGEHAVVYGRPALVVSLCLRTRALATRRDDRRVRLRLPDLGVDETTSWEEILARGTRARSAWAAFAEGGDGHDLESLRAADRALVVRTALAETARALAGKGEALASFDGELPGIELELSSALPIGAGFGSSASAAVAAAGALVALVTGAEDADLVDRVALEAERRQHGRPSGVDHRTVLYGGVQWAEWVDGRLRSEPVELAPGVLAPLTVFHTGTPAESTGRVVESVRERFAGESDRLEKLLESMGSEVLELRAQLTAGGEPRRVVDLFAGYERNLEALGVVPEAVREIVRAIESLGAAAKISGAGGLAGPGAGSLLAYDPDGALDGAACVAGLRRFDAELATPGLTIERME